MANRIPPKPAAALAPLPNGCENFEDGLGLNVRSLRKLARGEVVQVKYEEEVQVAYRPGKKFRRAAEERYDLSTTKVERLVCKDVDTRLITSKTDNESGSPEFWRVDVKRAGQRLWTEVTPVDCESDGSADDSVCK